MRQPPAFRLSQEDADLARRLLAEMSAAGSVARDPPLTRWLEEYAEFVQTVERGYLHSIYEYADELSIRDILEDLMERGSASLRATLARWLKPWDERFLRATQAVVNPLDPAEPPAALATISRIPIRMGEKLEADLRRNGIIQ